MSGYKDFHHWVPKLKTTLNSPIFLHSSLCCCFFLTSQQVLFDYATNITYMTDLGKCIYLKLTFKAKNVLFTQNEANRRQTNVQGIFPGHPVYNA